MSTRASGTFEVRLAPQPVHENAADTGLGRLSIDKEFFGDLAGTSKGEMLAMRTAVEDSAGYVAMEKVQATLHNRRGTFVLQHSSTMNRGVPQQSITVVPDSGLDELLGLTGTMIIVITDGKHEYNFDYILAEAH